MVSKSDSSFISGQKIPKKMDLLLKAAMEESFPHMLRFFYKDADLLFDMERGFEYMDKELLEIYPERLSRGGTRLADVLVKVFMKDGAFQWFLLHLEIQGKYSSGFPFRMFEYYYRLVDRFKVPVIAFAIFSGAENQQFSDTYHSSLLGTGLAYRYQGYQIFQHSAGELLAMDNPFALVVLAAQKAHLENKVSEAALGKERLMIFKAMLATGKYDAAQMLSFLGFLKQIIYIKDPEINHQFDLEIDNLKQGENNMGRLWDAVSEFMREEALINARIELQGPAGDEIRKEMVKELQTKMLKAAYDRMWKEHEERNEALVREEFLRELTTEKKNVVKKKLMDEYVSKMSAILATL
ncbi:hypothetical protein [Pedobacter gandavensis]|uniref:hypothetical protein n=1 Tax=Pedobacter gandavensis TaxID=2679963 RepID=UPI00292CBB71|nr:hypothetical protein [Pedobacter gandavensis]